MAKHDYPVELERLCWNASYRCAPLKAQTLENEIFVFSAMNKSTGVEQCM
jgi:hypothetical protein